jgi:uncharacterized YigZ family protein
MSERAPERYVVPARETRVELRVVNSRFIATAAPAMTVAAARDFIARVRAEFDDASHNVPAFVVGHGSRVIAHCSDDGEPSGTAGRPVLAVLQGSGLGDAAVVVTRYFGGTKLGTGGLVRAYSEAVRTVLRALPLAERVPTHTVLLAVPYALFEPTRRLMEEHRGEILDEDFAADVTLTARFAQARLPAFQAALRDLSAGRSEALVVVSDPATLMPLDVRGDAVLRIGSDAAISS